MKERPILFSGPMVRAILEGRKTQTRRIVKLPVKDPVTGGELAGCELNGILQNGEHVCPYGQPGDRLWVRETWMQVHPLQVAKGRFFLKGRAGIPGPPPVDYRVIYRADGEYPRIHFQEGEPKYPYREVCIDGCVRSHIHPEERWNGWAPSIHMPRWASRITLEIVSVRVERLQDITEEDAIAEGCSPDGRAEGTLYRGPIHPVKGTYKVYPCAKSAYKALWESINGPISWEQNPWLWVIEFKEVKS